MSCRFEKKKSLMHSRKVKSYLLPIFTQNFKLLDISSQVSDITLHNPPFIRSRVVTCDPQKYYGTGKENEHMSQFEYHCSLGADIRYYADGSKFNKTGNVRIT
jgi:hypothetical protein